MAGPQQSATAKACGLVSAGTKKAPEGSGSGPQAHSETGEGCAPGRTGSGGAETAGRWSHLLAGQPDRITGERRRWGESRSSGWAHGLHYERLRLSTALCKRSNSVRPKRP